MDIGEISELERRLLTETYTFELDSAGQPIPTEELLGILETDPTTLRLAFRRLSLKGLLVGQQLTVRAKLFVEDHGLLPDDRWNEVQAYRQVLAVTLVEMLTQDASLEGINADALLLHLPQKPGMLEFNLDVMADRGFIHLLRGNRITFGPRLRAVVGR